MLGSEETPGVREFGLHRSGGNYHDDSGPSEARLRHGKYRRHDHICELDGATWWPLLDDLSEVKDAAADNFSPPVAGPDIGQFESWLFFPRHGVDQ